jgi:malonate semialdehyde decarboxylase
MPLLNFHLDESYDTESTQKLLNAAHQAMVEAFEVPFTDRYQTVSRHRTGELVLHDTGLGMSRTSQAVLLSVVSRPRSVPSKVRFYELLSLYAQEQCGLRPEDLVVSLVENSDADWSFGKGRAQFLTGEL